jgi:glycerol-3-phosphate dehydrogenase (NAD(P)+)
MKVGIIGSGPWGKALATLVAEAGNQPRIGYRSHPPGGFPGTPNLASLVQESDLVLIAVPPSGVREAICAAKPGPGDRVVVAARGLEPKSGAWLTQVVIDTSTCLRVGMLTGPALASEVVKRRPSALVVASDFDEVCTQTQGALHSSICRIYSSSDMRGVELAAAMAHVMSVIIGLADALALGMGVHGLVVTRGLAEATRLGRAIGADEQTFAGLAGVGDLVACGSHPSHPSYQAGQRLVRSPGLLPDVIEATEGLLGVAAKHGVDLPLTAAIGAIAAGKIQPRLALDKLMRRDARAE